MDDESQRVVIEGGATLALLDEVLDALETLLAGAAVGSDEDRNFFMLAVSEVVTNVIQHGPDVPQPHVVVELSADPSALRATVSDDAPPAQIPWGEGATDELSDSGRGLAIARAVLTELSHVATTAGNVWRLARRF
ncbi:hypothetical protein GCM10028820_19840 [Tessaracoccus terricola]